MDQYAIVELSKEQVIKIIKKNLVQDENAQAPIDYDVIFTYDEDDEEITTTIVKTISIAEYQGSIREDIDEEDTIEMLSSLFVDEDDLIFDTYDIIYEDSDNDTDKKIFKGVRLRFELVYSYEKSFIK